MKAITKRVFPQDLHKHEASLILMDAYYLTQYTLFGEKVCAEKLEQVFKRLLEEHNELVQKHNNLVDLFFNEKEKD